MDKRFDGRRAMPTLHLKRPNGKKPGAWACLQGPNQKHAHAPGFFVRIPFLQMREHGTR